MSSISLVDRPLPRSIREVSLSSFTFLFIEIVQYCQLKSESGAELESKLADLGAKIGGKYLELAAIRNPPAAGRPKNLIQFLQFVHSIVWRQFFGRSADGLEKSTNSNEEFYLFDSAPVTNRFISMGNSSFNCAAFIAGFLSGILESANFSAEVSAHLVKDRTVYIMKFEKEVMKREKE